MKYFIVRTLSLLIVASLLSPAIAQQNKKFTFSGNLLDFPDGANIYLYNSSGKDTIAKAVIRNGKFVFSGTLRAEPQICFIRLDSNLIKELNLTRSSGAIWLTNNKIRMESGKNAWPALKITGSEIQTQYVAALRAEQQYQDSGEKLLNWKLEFVRNNTNSTFSPFLISSLFSVLGDEKIGALYDRLTPRSKNSFYGVELKKELTLGRLELGGKIGDFSGITPEGKIVSLKEVLKKNKFVLLDFWASWCKPCREGNPNLKAAYEKFHALGFDIVSITSDTKLIAWKNAIVQDSLPWIHISDKKISAAIPKMFSIKALPSYYLLDSSGKVIASDDPLDGTGGKLSDGKLEKKLAELLEKKVE